MDAGGAGGAAEAGGSYFTVVANCKRALGPELGGARLQLAATVNEVKKRGLELVYSWPQL